MFAADPEGENGWQGGFDLVLGNPPWDELTPMQKEFFAAYRPELPVLKRADQDAAVTQLLESPEISHDWDEYRRTRFATISFLKGSGRYRLFAPGNLGKGDFNVYRTFIETAMQLTRPDGYTAQIVPAASTAAQTPRPSAKNFTNAGSSPACLALSTLAITGSLASMRQLGLRSTLLAKGALACSSRSHSRSARRLICLGC